MELFDGFVGKGCGGAEGVCTVLLSSCFYADLLSLFTVSDSSSASIRSRIFGLKKGFHLTSMLDPQPGYSISNSKFI